MSLQRTRVKKTRFTAEELIRFPDTGRRLELVEGELYEMAPAGGRHGEVAMSIGIAVGSYVKRNRLGRVLAAETGFILERNPDTVKAPDVSFISAGRLPAGELPQRFLEMAPDLAVEVTSPNDSAREVEQKTDSWLAAGTSEVWVVSPQHRTVTVNRLGEPATVFDESETLTGGDLLPGFEVSVQELFE